MIDTIALRGFNLNGTDYAKGDKVPMPAQQFDDLEPTGLVERAPAAAKAKAKAAAAPKKVAKPPVVAPDPTDPQPTDKAD